MTTKEFMESRKAKALKGKEYTKILPELNNCDMIQQFYF
jgi:hypothetical protein